MSSETFDQEAKQTVITFLESVVPKSDVPNIKSELKTEFVLAKLKGKKYKKQPRKKKKQCLTRKEKKALSFYRRPEVFIKNGAGPENKVVYYSDFTQMNEIWEGYMKHLLELNKPIPECNSKNWDSFTQSIYKGDFHGSILEVVRSKCPSYVGKKGICIMDTRNTFKIVTKENKMVTIPKKECVFVMYLKSLKITVFGKHLCVRPAERSTKKIKGHSHPDL